MQAGNPVEILDAVPARLFTAGPCVAHHGGGERGGRLAMAKKLLSAAEIRHEINRRIQASDAHGEECRECRVPLPRHARHEDYGGNWHIEYAETYSPGCYDVIDRIVRDVRRETDCSDW